MTAHLAEALGTFALVFFGCGAIAVGAETGQLGHPVAGATLGALALRVTLGADADLGVTQPSGSELQALAWEALLTFFLMLVITAVATDTRAVGEAAALAIGGTVALGALVGGPVSGASMNPARSIGPALVSGELDALWIYLVGPVIGAIAAALVYRFLRSGSTVDERSS